MERAVLKYMSLFYDKDEYELATSTEMESLLAELPFDLIKESIIEQINDPVNSSTNYIDVILDKCEVYREEFKDNEELIAELNEKLIEFFTFIMDNINNKFELSINLERISSYSNAVDIGESIYKYFILRYHKNITRFFTKYIFNNKRVICEHFSDSLNQKKDVSTLAYKKQIKNPEDLCIITNLSSIIKYIIDLDIDPIDFINLSANQENYDACVIKGLISSSRLIGDFVPSYINLCVDSHDYILDELHTDIRLKIMKKIEK